MIFSFVQSFGKPAMIPLSMPHSSLPRRILKNPLSPQFSFHAKTGVHDIDLVINHRLTISSEPVRCRVFYTPTKDLHSYEKKRREKIDIEEFSLNTNRLHQGNHLRYVCRHLICKSESQQRLKTTFEQVHFCTTLPESVVDSDQLNKHFGRSVYLAHKE